MASMCCVMLQLFINPPTVNKRRCFSRRLSSWRRQREIVSSLVWVALQDQALSIFPHALYFSSERGLKLWGRGVEREDWIPRSGGHFTVVCKNEGTGQIVQRGSQVLQNVSGNESQFNRNDNVMSHAVNNAICLRIALWNDAARVRVDECAQGFIEVLEGAYRPAGFLRRCRAGTHANAIT